MICRRRKSPGDRYAAANPNLGKDNGAGKNPHLQAFDIESQSEKRDAIMAWVSKHRARNRNFMDVVRVASLNKIRSRGFD